MRFWEKKRDLRAMNGQLVPRVSRRDCLEARERNKSTTQKWRRVDFIFAVWSTFERRAWNPIISHSFGQHANTYTKAISFCALARYISRITFLWLPNRYIAAIKACSGVRDINRAVRHDTGNKKRALRFEYFTFFTYFVLFSYLSLLPSSLNDVFRISICNEKAAYFGLSFMKTNSSNSWLRWRYQVAEKSKRNALFHCAIIYYFVFEVV